MEVSYFGLKRMHGADRQIELLDDREQNYG